MLPVAAEANMNLELASGRTIRGVRAEELLSHIEGEEFAILSMDAVTYIQCARQGEATCDYVLEYQGGSLENHFRATDEPITLERVVLTLQKYLRGDETWRTDLHWEKVKL
jgi:hypothetical protein